MTFSFTRHAEIKASFKNDHLKLNSKLRLHLHRMSSMCEDELFRFVKDHSYQCFCSVELRPQNTVTDLIKL